MNTEFGFYLQLESVDSTGADPTGGDTMSELTKKDGPMWGDTNPERRRWRVGGNTFSNSIDAEVSISYDGGRTIAALTVPQDLARDIGAALVAWADEHVPLRSPTLTLENVGVLQGIVRRKSWTNSED